MSKEIKKNKKRNKGFTLIEILVAVLILAILVAIAAPSYMRAVERSRTSDPINTLKSIAKAEQVQRFRAGEYTNQTQDLDLQLRDYPAGNTVAGDTFEGQYYTYKVYGEDEAAATAGRKTTDEADFYELSVDYGTGELFCRPSTNKTCIDLGLEEGKDFSAQNSTQEVVKGKMEHCPSFVMSHDGSGHLFGNSGIGRGSSCQYRLNSDGSYDVFTCEMGCRLYSYDKNGMYKGMTDCWGGYDSNYDCINGEGFSESTNNFYDDSGNILYCSGGYASKNCSSAIGNIYGVGIIYTTDEYGRIISEQYCRSVDENGTCTNPMGQINNYEYDMYGNIKKAESCYNSGCSSVQYEYNEQSVKIQEIDCDSNGSCSAHFYVPDDNGNIVLSRDCLSYSNGTCTKYNIGSFNGYYGEWAESFSYDANGNRTSFGTVRIDDNGNPTGDVFTYEAYEYLNDGSYIRKMCNSSTSLNGNCDVFECIKYSLDGNMSHC